MRITSSSMETRGTLQIGYVSSIYITLDNGNCIQTLVFLFPDNYSVLLQRLRTQVNGKILEEGNAVHINGSMNGGT